MSAIGKTTSVGKIIDEVCSCGHSISQHCGQILRCSQGIALLDKQGYVRTEEGHGRCDKQGCPCSMFTWDCFVYEES